MTLTLSLVHLGHLSVGLAVVCRDHLDIVLHAEQMTCSNAVYVQRLNCLALPFDRVLSGKYDSLKSDSNFVYTLNQEDVQFHAGINKLTSLLRLQKIALCKYSFTKQEKKVLFVVLSPTLYNVDRPVC